jgi:hypothetical protein
MVGRAGAAGPPPPGAQRAPGGRSSRRRTAGCAPGWRTPPGSPAAAPARAGTPRPPRPASRWSAQGYFCACCACVLSKSGHVLNAYFLGEQVCAAARLLRLVPPAQRHQHGARWQIGCARDRHGHHHATSHVSWAPWPAGGTRAPGAQRPCTRTPGWRARRRSPGAAGPPARSTRSPPPCGPARWRARLCTGGVDIGLWLG